VAQSVRVRTPEGLLVLENLPRDAEVDIDGAKATVRQAGQPDTVEVRALPGKRERS